MKIGAKCDKCRNDKWKMRNGKPVCFFCNPRLTSRKFPRIIRVVKEGKRWKIIKIMDTANLKFGERVIIHKEKWGYRVLVRFNKRKTLKEVGSEQSHGT